MGVLALGGSDCEALSDGWFAQPANSASSLAYVAAGVVVARLDRHVLAAIALVAVGLGSVLYHGPMPSGARVVHDGSIAALGAALIAAATRGRLARPPLVAVALGATAVVLYGLSRTGAPLCRPGSLLQGHAAWHVLTAAAIALWLRGPTRPRGGASSTCGRRAASMAAPRRESGTKRSP